MPHSQGSRHAEDGGSPVPPSEALRHLCGMEWQVLCDGAEAENGPRGVPFQRGDGVADQQPERSEGERGLCVFRDELPRLRRIGKAAEEDRVRQEAFELGVLYRC